MLRQVRYTLLADGPSDRMLLPILGWLLSQIYSSWDCRLIPQFADPRTLQKESRGLAGKVAAAMRQYPCDLLFVHRDAEGESREKRVQEIREAMSPYADQPYVCVVPVRMTEAWLLTDEKAIRRAADNPSSQSPIALPRVRDLEKLTDPKETLRQLLRDASELHGRRRHRFYRDLAWRCQRVAELISDFTGLLNLSSFAACHEETLRAVQALPRS